MGVIRVTKDIEEFTVDNFFDSNKQPETSNPITVNPVNNSAEMSFGKILKIKVEIIS